MLYFKSHVKLEVQMEHSNKQTVYPDVTANCDLTSWIIAFIDSVSVIFHFCHEIMNETYVTLTSQLI
jgi:hypothetical protein